MTVEVVDFFRIDEAAGGSEPVATLVGYELQGDATSQFRELWQRRPREVEYHYGDSSEDACVLYARDVTLEDSPTPSRGMRLHRKQAHHGLARLHHR